VLKLKNNSGAKGLMGYVAMCLNCSQYLGRIISWFRMNLKKQTNLLQMRLTLWRRNYYFLNFSTLCI